MVGEDIGWEGIPELYSTYQEQGIEEPNRLVRLKIIYLCLKDRLYMSN